MSDMELKVGDTIRCSGQKDVDNTIKSLQAMGYQAQALAWRRNTVVITGRDKRHD